MLALLYLVHFGFHLLWGEAVHEFHSLARGCDVLLRRVRLADMDLNIYCE